MLRTIFFPHCPLQSIVKMSSRGADALGEKSYESHNIDDHNEKSNIDTEHTAGVIGAPEQNALHRSLKGRHMQMIAMYV